MKLTLLTLVLGCLVALTAARPFVPAPSTQHANAGHAIPAALLDKEVIVQEPHTHLPRGGGHLTKSKVIQAHGYTAYALGVIFLLESFGIPVPLGPSATMPSFDATNVTTQILLRFAVGLMVLVGLVETNMADDAQIQDWYKWYHLPLAGLQIYTCMEHATEKIHWLNAALTTLYGLGGVFVD